MGQYYFDLVTDTKKFFLLYILIKYFFSILYDNILRLASLSDDRNQLTNLSLSSFLNVMLLFSWLMKNVCLFVAIINNCSTNIFKYILIYFSFHKY